jgi:hypothetical protein
MSTRRIFLEKVPWIKRLKNSTTCDSTRHNAPLKLYTGTDEQRAEITLRFACRAIAYWRFTALRNSRYAKSGTYCMSHLYTQMEDEREAARLSKWHKRYTDLENPTGR